MNDSLHESRHNEKMGVVKVCFATMKLFKGRRSEK